MVCIEDINSNTFDEECRMRKILAWSKKRWFWLSSKF